MAIKGKGKTRSRRVIAAPPRPQVVVRKPPIWRRAWTWVVLGVLVAAAVAFPVFFKVRADARVHRTDREIAAVRTFADRLRKQLPEDVQTIPPDLLVMFPTLRQDMEDLKQGTQKPAQARKRADEVREAGAKAAAGIEGIQIERIIPAEFPEDRAKFQDAKEFLVQSFRLYGDVADLFVLSIGQKDQARDQLIEQSQEIMGRAGNLFDTGFRLVVGTLRRLGITTPIVPAAPPAPVPTGTPEPTVTTSPAATPTAEASPTSTGETSPSPGSSPTP